ncbi:phage tail protein [Providencia sp. wls1921]|uniref:phage tail protein n=1 Tax=Providencia sp. wls1921 TaxID=2675153 RepID=UPI0018A73124|nr:phage tail protein [Providencia sp. wls1921]
MAMAALGLFVFELRTTPFQAMQREHQFRFGYHNRIGKRPSYQFLGPSNDPITLSGTLYPELTGGKFSLLALQAMAETGKAWSFIGGDGTIYGMYVIESLSENKSDFFEDSAARKIEFTLTIKRVDESLSEMFGNLNEQLNSVMDAVSNGIGGMLG